MTDHADHAHTSNPGAVAAHEHGHHAPAWAALLDGARADVAKGGLTDAEYRRRLAWVHTIERLRDRMIAGLAPTGKGSAA